MLVSAIVLGLAALAAAALAYNRSSPPDRQAERDGAALALAAATAVQAVHFAEEAATGFHERLPGLFGLAAIPFSVFLAFNLAWLGIWGASIPGLRSGRRLAFFAAWFLSIAGIFNGIAHPLLALAADTYFPGLATSTFIAAASVWLWLRLRAATVGKTIEEPRSPPS
jgi:hypothetical protein